MKRDLADLGYLIVDDDEVTCHIVSEILERVIGTSKVKSFSDSVDFANKLINLSYKPDIIFLDIFIKPINGYKMLEIIRSHPKFDTSKVVSLTASVMPQSIDQMKLANFDGMISKPIIFDAFPNLIQLIWEGNEVWYVA